MEVLDAAVDADVRCGIDGGRFFEGAAGAYDLEDARKSRLAAAGASSSEDRLTESPRAVNAGVVLEAVVDGLLSRSTTFLEMGTSSQERARLVPAVLGVELKEALVVLGA